MGKPAILTVDDDPGVSRAVARDLRRRYGEEFRILRAASAAEGLEVLCELKLRGGRVAVLLADYRTPQSWATPWPATTAASSSPAPTCSPVESARGDGIGTAIRYAVETEQLMTDIEDATERVSNLVTAAKPLRPPPRRGPAGRGLPVRRPARGRAR